MLSEKISHRGYEVRVDEIREWIYASFGTHDGGSASVDVGSTFRKVTDTDVRDAVDRFLEYEGL